jgi:hypothetical protein
MSTALLNDFSGQSLWIDSRGDFSNADDRDFALTHLYPFFAAEALVAPCLCFGNPIGSALRDAVEISFH